MKKIFITGASSGIGEALALAYSKKKYIIGIADIRLKSLKEVALKCTELGGKILIYKLDVNKQNDCKAVANQFQKEAEGIDIVIANAGIWGDDGLFSNHSKKINAILNTNILGVTNTTLPFIPFFKKQSSGTLVCISSVASFIPLPFRGGYSGSKIAIRMIFDSWRPTLNRYNIKVITICPGFIDTAIAKGPIRGFPLHSVDNAANKFIKIIDQGNKTYVYPWYYIIIIIIKSIIPNSIYNWSLKKMYRR